MILYRPDPKENPYWYIAKRADGSFLGEIRPNKVQSWREWVDDMNHKDIYGFTKKELLDREQNIKMLEA